MNRYYYVVLNHVSGEMTLSSMHTDEDCPVAITLAEQTITVKFVRSVDQAVAVAGKVLRYRDQLVDILK